MKNIYYYLPFTLLSLAACTTGNHDMSDPKWEQLASGIWQTSVGQPEKINLRSELSILPKWDDFFFYMTQVDHIKWVNT